MMDHSQSWAQLLPERTVHPTWENYSQTSSSTVQYFLPEELTIMQRYQMRDWESIVRANNPSSLSFLTQKLQSGTTSQKRDIFEAVTTYASSLMTERYGSRLVQCCLQHGTNGQISMLAKAICGRTLGLSKNVFGSRVVQQAIQLVPDIYKTAMIKELIPRILETICHVNASYIWQAIIQYHPKNSGWQIMLYVNSAILGWWRSVACDQNGSLVVQAILTNCTANEKRPCIEELLADIDIMAYSQCGTWCIQHICRYGDDRDRIDIMNHVIKHVDNYSTNEFAHWVVKVCLEKDDFDFVKRYTDCIYDDHSDTLSRIASNQYGNRLIKYILKHLSNKLDTMSRFIQSESGA